MTDRLIVDVVGPAGRRPLSVPADAVVAELMPSLVRLVGDGSEADDDAWALAPPVGRPLPPAASLREGGIRTGSVLYLVSTRLAVDADGILPPRALVGMRTPVDRTAALLPGRLTRWQRSRAAITLAGAGAVPGPAPSTPALHPSFFTQTRSARPWQRAWRAWRALDYLGRLDAAIAAPRLARCVTIAVVSALPGAGKTIVASLLCKVLAELRRDGIVALDANPGPDSLTVLLARSPGIRVLPDPRQPDEMDRLRRSSGLVIVDCGAGLDGRIVEAADQVVVVTGAGEEARAALGPTVDALRRAGRRSVLLAANAPRGRMPPGEVGRLAVSAPDADGLVLVPWSPTGAARLTAGAFDWSQQPPEWAGPARELAAALVADWMRLTLAM